MGDVREHEAFDIPQECIAGVVKNEGPDFEIEVKKVPVPEIGMSPRGPSQTFSPFVVTAWGVAGDEHFLDFQGSHRPLLIMDQCLGPEEVLIKMNATGLCMSDVHFMMKDLALPAMSSFGTVCAGHEGAGVIVKIGERVRTLKVGQRAGVKPLYDCCHNCDQCKRGKDNYCPGVLYGGLQVDGMIKPWGLQSPIIGCL